MPNIVFNSDPLFLEHQYPQSHPEHDGRLTAILLRLQETTLWDELKKPLIQPASLSQLAFAHDMSYLEKLRTSTSQYLDSDTFCGEVSFDCAALASGALITAVDETIHHDIKFSFSAVRPPGHHAEHDKAMGFCLINHVAVAAKYAQTKGFQRILIIDFDVHHGNGTQHIFENDDSVFYLSSHQYPLFPGTGSRDEIGIGRGEGYTVNWPLPIGTDGFLLCDLYQEELPGIISQFKPDMIFVSAGYDIHRDDPLGGFNVFIEEIRTLVRVILTSSKGIPIHFSLEGGYNVEALAESVEVTLKQMFDFI